MSKKIFLFLFLLFIAVLGVYVLKEYFTDRVDSYKSDLNSKENQVKLYKFLTMHNKKSVFLDLSLDEIQNNEFKNSYAISPYIDINTFSAKLNESIKYIFNIREDGKKDFIYEEKKQTLKGLFIPYIQKIDQNKTVINIITITPREVKAIK